MVRDFNRVDSCFAGSNILRDLCLKGRGRLDWRPLSVHPLDLILTSHCESTPGASRIAPVANENLEDATPPLTRHSSCIKIAAAPRKHWCSKGRLRRTFKPGKGAPGRPRLSASTACRPPPPPKAPRSRRRRVAVTTWPSLGVAEWCWQSRLQSALRLRRTQNRASGRRIANLPSVGFTQERSQRARQCLRL